MQYKNRFNLGNLCKHHKNHEIHGSWNFFATSHGKSPCDGIGGTTKRLARLANLKAINSYPIVSSTELYKWCSENIKGIHFFYVDEQEVLAEEKRLMTQFKTTLQIPKIQKLHSFIPNNDHQLKVSRLSGSNESTVVQVQLLI